MAEVLPLALGDLGDTGPSAAAAGPGARRPPEDGRDGPALPLGRRLQTLLYTAPLHELEANKLRRGEWLAAYDLRTLQLEGLWAVIRGQGLDAGVARATAVGAVAACAARMAPDGSRRQQVEVAEIVVGWLLNEQAGESGFHYDYVDRDGDGRLARFGYDVVLLRERQQADGSLLLLASPGAINLFIGALDVDVADAQRADERLLEEYIASGRFDAAEQQAQRAYLRSKQYAEMVRHWLQLAEQDIRLVDWSGTVLAAMDEARRHIAERLNDEAHIRFRLDEHRAEIEDLEKLRTIARLGELIDDCQRRHTHLHSLLMNAADVFLAEQQRQRLAPPPPVHLVSPHRDLLLPLLGMPPAPALEAAGACVTALLGPRPPELVDLFYLVDDLLAPRREYSEDELYAEEVVFDAAAEPSRFPPEAFVTAGAVLAAAAVRPMRLGALLAEGRERVAAAAARDPEAAAAAADAVGELIRLAALWAFAPEPETGEPFLPRDVLAADDGTTLDDPRFGGADLLLGPVEGPRRD